jgi:sugar phosphate isomerase/epimerase
MLRRRSVVGSALIALTLALGATAAFAQEPAKRDIGPSKKLGWRLGAQAWTFRALSLMETIDTLHALDLHYIEMFPGQKLAPDGDAKFDHNSPKEMREKVKAKLKESGVRLMNYGVVDLPADEAKSRVVFDFAKDMGIETIVSEPKEDAWDTVEKLVKEYDIKVAIHDHPKPSRYWNPDHVLEVIQGRDARIGACADTGHWPRSGLSALESMKKLEGHIISFHFKDLNEFGKREAHDVPWGTGVSDARALLEEAKRQNFKGVFSIEYETTTGQELIDNVKKCIEWFDKTTKELAE